jgi:hypothetical protein
MSDNNVSLYRFIPWENDIHSDYVEYHTWVMSEMKISWLERTNPGYVRAIPAEPLPTLGYLKRRVILRPEPINIEDMTNLGARMILAGLIQ